MVGLPQIGSFFWTNGTTRLGIYTYNIETYVRYHSHGYCWDISRWIVSIPIALICASNIVKTKWISIPARFILNIAYDTRFITSSYICLSSW